MRKNKWKSERDREPVLFLCENMVPPAEPRKGERNEENELCRSDY